MRRVAQEMLRFEVQDVPHDVAMEYVPAAGRAGGAHLRLPALPVDSHGRVHRSAGID